MDVAGFQQLIIRLTEEINNVPLDASMEAHLNAEHGPGSYWHEQVFEACQTGVRAEGPGAGFEFARAAGLGSDTAKARRRRNQMGMLSRRVPGTQ